MSILSSLITSKTRIKILMRLFLNPERQAYLRELSGDFKISSSQVAEELQQMSAAGLLTSHKNGRQINYQANTEHALFPELHSMVKKALGMDHIVESILERLGDLDMAFLIDDYAEGKDTGLIDLILVGHVDKSNLDDLVTKSERYIKRKIRTFVITNTEYKNMKNIFKDRSKFLLWESDKGSNT